MYSYTKPMNSNIKRSGVWMPLIVAISLAIGLLIGSRQTISISHKSTSGLGKLQTIFDIISASYVDDINSDSIIERSLPDILAQLDPHSTYIPASELQFYNEDLDSSFSGIGIRFNTLNDTITVDEVISGGPSEKVGILPGDRIVTINDSIAAGVKWSNEKILKTLRGPKNSTVNLGVIRQNSHSVLNFTVTRDDIPVVSVDASYIISPSVGYIKISKFAADTYKEVLTALTLLKNQGANKYIIDLRGNTGGLMQSAVDIANEFLERDAAIVSMRGRLDQYNASFAANGLGSFTDAEITVLIDEISASASEILAGAIQDNDRGTVIGRRSFGKGLVQNQIDLPDNSAIRLTVARYYTPSGRCIQKTYSPGNLAQYSNEIAQRYIHGEGFSADSISIDKSKVYHTVNGREVYGGGGIIPDIFVPNDTIGISDYYIKVFNAGMLQKYSFYYSDTNRTSLQKCKTVDQLIKALPSDEKLLSDFVSYAHKNGNIAPRWYYINQSRDLIVSVLKALIARDILGTSAYYEIMNETDTSVAKAIENLNAK